MLNIIPHDGRPDVFYLLLVVKLGRMHANHQELGEFRFQAFEFG